MSLSLSLTANRCDPACVLHLSARKETRCVAFCPVRGDMPLDTWPRTQSNIAGHLALLPMKRRMARATLSRSSRNGVHLLTGKRPTIACRSMTVSPHGWVRIILKKRREDSGTRCWFKVRRHNHQSLDAESHWCRSCILSFVHVGPAIDVSLWDVSGVFFLRPFRGQRDQALHRADPAARKACCSSFCTKYILTRQTTWMCRVTSHVGNIARPSGRRESINFV